MNLKTFCTKQGAKSAFNCFTNIFNSKKIILSDLPAQFDSLDSDIKNHFYSISKSIIIDFLDTCKTDKIKLEEIQY